MNRIEESLYENNWMVFGVEIYFRIRRVSYFLKHGFLSFPIVFSIGRHGIGSGWLVKIRR